MKHQQNNMALAIFYKEAKPPKYISKELPLYLSIITILTLLTLILMFLAYRSTIRLGIFLNEGYNTNLIQRFMLGHNLYPEIDTGMVNNYTPLWFILIATISRITGDIVFTGRAIGWLSFIGCLTEIYLILRAVSCKRAESIFGATIFGGLIVTSNSIYIGSLEPQITGHMISLLSLLLLITGERKKNRNFIILSALSAVLSVFIKQNLVVIPITIVLWLAWNERRFLALWAGAAIVSGGVILALCVMTFGSPFLSNMTAPRALYISNIWRRFVPWIIPLEAPVAIAAMAWLGNFNDRTARLFGLQFLVACGAGILQSMGEGLGRNALFDLFLAVALSIGYFIHYAGNQARQEAFTRWLAPICAVSIVVAGIFYAKARTVDPVAWLNDLHRDAYAAEQTIAFLKNRPGRVLCAADTTLCYWGGHIIEFDIYNYSKAVFWHQLDPRLLASEIEKQQFQVIRQPELGWPDKTISDAIAAGYVSVDPLLPDMLVPLPNYRHMD